jgi:uncharacterized protein (DUF1501 family)
MKRRDFIKEITTLVAIPGIGNMLIAGNKNPLPLLNAIANADDSDRVLVLIQLKGGNDGLNTVIPLDQYSAYSNARKEVAIAQSAVLPLNGYEKSGLHPAMTALQKRFNDGKVKIIQAVGYPSPNYSHFRATDIWLSASNADEIITSGWAGRYLDTVYPGFPEGYPNTQMPDPLSIEVGSVLSQAFQGGQMNLSISVSDPTNFYKLINGIQDPVPDTPAGKELAYIRTTALQTNQYASVIQNAANQVTQQSDTYPETGVNSLADQLKIVARLIAGGLKTKIYLVSLGGFDTHNSQVDDLDSSTGTHASLLKKLSDAIDVFMTDLEFLNIAKRVTGMTFSEFGRRIIANKSLGTDHGAAAPLFIFGNQVIPGILGNNPTIPSSVTTSDNIPMQYDFRAVYASLLNQWFGVDKSIVDGVLLRRFENIPLINTNTGFNNPKINNLSTYKIEPNPFKTKTNITFETENEEVLIEIFNSKGEICATLVNEILPKNNYSIEFNSAGLPSGIYFAKMQKNESIQTLALIKS